MASSNPEHVSTEHVPPSPHRDIVDEPSHPVDGHGETGERRRTHHDIPDHGHNPSMQQGVDPNPDLALHYSHEHQHKHLHHNRASLAGRHDEVLYSEGTTYDKAHIDPKGPQDYVSHNLRDPHNEKTEFAGDAEKGALSEPLRMGSNGSEDDGQKHRASRSYSKYKIFVHLFIWLLFTG